MSLIEPKSLTRIADSLEKLAALYELELLMKGISLNPSYSGEGEVLVTDDAEVAERIERARSFTGIPNPGFYVGAEPEGILDSEGKPRGPEVAVNYPEESLFGSSWGLNVGPEGAEENRAGPDSDGSAGK